MGTLGLLALVLIVLAFPVIAKADNCTPQTIYTGLCTVSGELDDQGAVLTGNQGVPGGQGGDRNPVRRPPGVNTPDFDDDGSGGAGAGDTGAGDGAAAGAPDAPACGFTGPAADLCWITTPEETVTVVGPVTLADIAAFRPDSAVDHMEPNGWTIAGLETNFYASGGTDIEGGTLLGQPANVRFTPVAWHWSYGDGAAASHPFPGDGWAALRLREFDSTGTSHVYDTYGGYTIDLNVEYSAAYRFAGGPWTAIAGTLTIPADPLRLTVGDATTVLVQSECTDNPAGPGC